LPHRFVNNAFADDIAHELSEIDVDPEQSPAERTALKKERRQRHRHIMAIVKADLLTNAPVKSEGQYRAFVEEHRPHVVAHEYLGGGGGVVYTKDDVFAALGCPSAQPGFQRALIYMARKSEGLGRRSPAWFPTRRSHTPMYIQQDSRCISQLLGIKYGPLDRSAHKRKRSIP
jgi:hypothetical protein